MLIVANEQSALGKLAVPQVPGLSGQ